MSTGLGRSGTWLKVSTSSTTWSLYWVQTNSGYSADRKYEFTENEFTFVEGKGNKDSLSFTLNVKKKPAQMDLREKDETIRAIYKLEKDVLTIAFNEGKGRPKGFDKSDGLLVLKRRAAKK